MDLYLCPFKCVDFTYYLEGHSNDETLFWSCSEVSSKLWAKHFIFFFLTQIISSQCLHSCVLCYENLISLVLASAVHNNTKMGTIQGRLAWILQRSLLRLVCLLLIYSLPVWTINCVLNFELNLLLSFVDITNTAPSSYGPTIWTWPAIPVVVLLSSHYFPFFTGRGYTWLFC